MQVVFVKGPGGRTCRWHALRPPRTRVPGPAMAAGKDLPHDLATFVIEQHLGIERGFWGCVAIGATFRSLPRRRTPQGRDVIRRHADQLDAAEARVGEIYRAWRDGAPTAATADLDAALAEWRALPDGGELVRTWTIGRRAQSRTSLRTRFQS
jgi:hypothetical protein